MKIYVVGSSKNSFLPLDNIREKFFVDETHDGDNIDFLNPWYCELTGLYYLCKNVDDNIVGLEHYRRYFVNECGNLLSENDINCLLKTNDVICRKCMFSMYNHKTAIEILNKTGVTPYLEKFLTTLPQDETNFILNALNNNDFFEQCNMCICKSTILEEWLNWFIEHAIIFTSHELFNKPRIIGYIAEYVFGCFLKYRHYKIVYAPSVTYDPSLSKVIEVCK